MSDAPMPETTVRDLLLILWIQGLRAFLYGFGSVLIGTELAVGGLSAAAVGLDRSDVRHALARQRR